MAEEVRVYRHGRYILLAKPRETPAKHEEQEEEDNKDK